MGNPRAGDSPRGGGDPRRHLPSVASLLEKAERDDVLNRLPREVVVAAIRRTLEAARLQGLSEPPPRGWMSAILGDAQSWRKPSLRRVINATGVVLHTNLGRAPLSYDARRAVMDAFDYSTLEFDLETGSRGSRQAHTRTVLRELTGAADALVTVNAASALLLAVNTLAADRETIVSRGELVEIGGSFRLPEVIEKSTSRMVEVGTTNRTHIRDYLKASGPETSCVLKVHRSNFVQSGFVTEVSVAELVEAFNPSGVPVVHDAGSGLLIDLADWGLKGEPLVRDSVAAGATTIFSGDKLLGGPQAGIILGSEEVISRMSANPLARAVRPDKATLAGLEATLTAYRHPETALEEIPVLRMLTADPEELAQRAAALSAAIPGSELAPGFSSVGGGSFPGCELPTTLVTVRPPSCDELIARLRDLEPAIIARIAEDRVVFDPRTIGADEIEIAGAEVARVLDHQ